MKQWFLLLTLSSVILLSACTGSANQANVKDSLKQRITEAESAFTQKNTAIFDPKSAQNAVTAYQNFADSLPKDAETPAYLFKAGELYRSLKEYDKAFAVYERILADYNTYEKAPHSLFLIGFTYENDVKDLEKAKAAYERFLKTYPDHELADDVEFSLGNLGKSPDEIIKAFSEKNANNNQAATPQAPANPKEKGN